MSLYRVLGSFIVLATGCASLLGADDLSFDGRCAGDPSCEGQAGAGGEGTGAGSACTTHLDCNRRLSDEPHVCLQRTCVPLKNDSTTCSAVMGEPNLRRNTPPFVFGILTGLPIEEYAAAAAHALAVSEFSSRGLRVRGESVLPVAVACNVVGVAEEYIDASIDHLVDTLGVPLLVTSLDGVTLKRSFERVRHGKGKDVFFLSTFESDPLLTTIDDRGLLWHMLPAALELAPIFLPVVTRAEEHVRRALGDEGERPLRLALLESTLPTDADIAAYLDANLTINGGRARDDGDDYLRLKVDASVVNETPSTSKQLQSVVAFQPDIVVAVGGDEIVDRIMAPLENLRVADQRGPFYVLSPTAIEALHLVERHPSLQSRIAGVNFAGAEDPELYEAFLSSFKSAFPTQDGRGAENFYDATYFALYAAAGGGKVPELTGSDIARGMRRLIDYPDGLARNVGATDIPNVLSYLLSGDGTLALQGTMGPPWFDAGTGARRGFGSVWCVSVAGGVPRFEFDVLRYDADTASLRGDFTCFEDF